MNGNDLAKMYEFSYRAICRNLDGVSHEESLLAPADGGNCLNWVLGHIVTARSTVLTLAGATPIPVADKLSVYGRGATCDENTLFLDLATLHGYLDDSNQRLLPALSQLSEAALNREVPQPYRKPPTTGSVGEALVRLHYHEGYHNGQIGLLRRIAGKDGAIR